MLSLFLTHLQGFKRQAAKAPLLMVFEVICELLLRRRDWKLQRTAARNAAARRAGPAQRRYAARH